MKIRSGFVSNSSSSSFVLVGYLLKDKNLSRFFELAKKLDPDVAEYETVEDLVKEEGHTVETWDDSILVRAGTEENGLAEGKTFIGRYISSGDGYLDDAIVSLASVKDELETFEDGLKEDEKDLKILIGTEEC